MQARTRGGGRLPPTLREVLFARIVALPECAQTVIGVAAVAGGRVDHDILAQVAGLADEDLLDGLRDAVGSHVLVTGPAGAGGDYEFRHALLQEAAYDDLLPGERQRLHRAFAEALSAKGPGSGAIAAGHWGELAYHWAAARDEPRAFEASVRAGEAAARAFAFADARRHDERALESWTMVDDPETLAGIDRVDLLGRAAEAAWLSGKFAPRGRSPARGRRHARDRCRPDPPRRCPRAARARPVGEHRDRGSPGSPRAGDGDHADRPAHTRAGARPVRVRPGA